jgi:TonB-dependent starch-binding outer membrane protein SusC
MLNSLKWRSGILSLLLLGMMCIPTFAQQRTVTGTVTSEEMGPLPGVNIVIQGTTQGAVTGIDGKYTINVPGPDAVLVFSYIGYSTVAISVGNQSVVDAVLVADVTALDEIVVTGYTSVRKGDITGAVSIVNADDMNQITSASVLQKLEGRAAGVSVNVNGQPGSRNTIRIRGISSFTDNDPLYIVDGVPVETNSLNFLNPNDIESMQVLKDPSTASVYGARANNGVIIITTKKGQKGKAKLTVDVNVGLQNPVKGLNQILIQDALDYHKIVKASYENAGLAVPTNIYGDPNNPTIPNYTWPNNGTDQTMTVDESTYSWPDNLIMPASTGTDWWDEVFDPSLVQDYNIGMSGGTDNSVYNVSVQYYNQDGTMKYNWLDRVSLRANTEFKFGRLSVGENFSISRIQNVAGLGSYSTTNQNMGEGSIVNNIIKMQPVVAVYDIDGYFGGAKANSLGNGTNPVAQAYHAKDNRNISNQMVGNVYAAVNILEGLQFKSSMGVNSFSSIYKGFNYPTPENSEPTMVWSMGENYATSLEWTWTNTLNYVNSFGNHNINALAGYEAIDYKRNSMNASMAGYVSTDLAAWYIQDALGDPSTKQVYSYGAVSSLVSMFAKLDYNFASKYYLSGTVRRDGSSKFGPNNRFGVFPAFSAGWRISDESFMSNLTWLSDLRFRGGWGLTGNQNIPSGRTANQYGGSTSQTFYDINGTNSSIVTGYRLTALGNEDLKWEENESANVGFDLAILDRRINVVLDVYKRTVNDLLYGPQIPATAGQASPPIVNIGTMENKGLDFSVGYRSKLTGKFQWNVEVIGSHYKNEIVKIDGVQDFFYGPQGGRKGTFVINEVGSPISSFYGYQQDGIFQNQGEVDAHATQDGAAVGRFRWKDVNGDGTITADDRTIVGSPHPDFTGGLNFDATYGNFDMSLFLFGSYGNEIWNQNYEFTVFRLYSTNVREDRLTDSWTPTNTGGKYPQLDQNDQYSDQYSSFYVEDGSYLRLKNIQIGYNLPKMGWFQSVRIYIQGQNLFTLTKYTGLDPALPTISTSGSSGNQSDQAMGIDYGPYPANRIFTIGINANF